MPNPCIGQAIQELEPLIGLEGYQSSNGSTMG